MNYFVYVELKELYFVFIINLILIMYVKMIQNNRYIMLLNNYN